MADVRISFPLRRRLADLVLPQARLLVEDAKNGIRKYVKRKWINIRAAGGFDSLQNWCLKELADGERFLPRSTSFRH